MKKRAAIYFITLLFFISFKLFAEPQIKITASQEEYFNQTEESQLTASDNGIYPVRLCITTLSNDKTLYIKVYRAEDYSGPFHLIIDYMQPNEESFNLYDTSPMELGKKYYYIAVCGKKNLEDADNDQKSNITCGWGALTAESFYVFFNTSLSKSYKKMTLMNKAKAISKLGKEESRGDKSGTFTYSAKVKGIGGHAVMTYNNYSDDNIVSFSGEMITDADMFSSGTMDGVMTMSGMYNGKIFFSDIIVKEGKAAAGSYGIEPAGSSRKNISYTWNFKTLD